MKRVLPIVIALVVLIGFGLVAHVLTARPNRTIVRNSSGATLDDVHLTIRSLDGARTIEKHVRSLGPSRAITVRHGMNDSSIDLVFGKGGKEHTSSVPYVDLWRGESWILDVQPDGTVRSGYESTMQEAEQAAPR